MTKRTTKPKKAAAPQQQGGKERKPLPQWFKPGQSGNPGGRPVGSRNKLQGDFMAALAEDFGAHGKEALERCRQEKPDAYIKVVASLMPKELELKRPLQELTDDELDIALALVRERIEAARHAGEGAGATPGRNTTH